MIWEKNEGQKEGEEAAISKLPRQHHLEPGPFRQALREV